MICVVDAGSGNLRSLCNGLRRSGFEPAVAQLPPRETPRVIILPGVGAFGHASRELEARGWFGAIPGFLESGAHIVGICLGMQLLFQGSEESPGERGLGVIRGAVRRLDGERGKVPHIGWARIRFEAGVAGRLPWAYFVHSYAAVPDDPAVVEAWAERGGGEFAAVVRSGRAVGVQFHPEKSQGPGLDYLAGLVGGGS